MPPPTRTPSLPGATFATKRQFKPPGPARSSGEAAPTQSAEPPRAAASRPASRSVSETTTNGASKSKAVAGGGANGFRSAATELDVNMIISSSSDDEFASAAMTKRPINPAPAKPTEKVTAAAATATATATASASKPAKTTTVSKPKAAPKAKPKQAPKAKPAANPPPEKRQKLNRLPSLSPPSSRNPSPSLSPSLHHSSSPGFEITTTNTRPTRAPASSPPASPLDLSSETIPLLPASLLTRLLHESYTFKTSTKISKEANTLMTRYFDVFVRESVARATLAYTEKKKLEGENEVERRDGDGDGGGGVGQEEIWLDVQELEEVAPGLVLDF